jgi:hypothetical protein
MGMSIGVGLFPANTLMRSNGDLRSRSATEHITGAGVAPSAGKAARVTPLAHSVGWLWNLCLRKRPSFLASRRFAWENPTQ